MKKVLNILCSSALNEREIESEKILEKRKLNAQTLKVLFNMEITE